MQMATEHHQASVVRTGKKVQLIAAELVNKHIPLILEHMSGRHAFSKPRSDLHYDDEHEAATLITLVPTDFDQACKVSKSLIRKKGMARHKELTGISKLRCRRTRVQLKAEGRGEYIMPLSHKRYDTMASFIEARTKQPSEQKMQAAIKEIEEAAKTEAAEEVNKHMKAETTISHSLMKNNAKSFRVNSLKANDMGADRSAKLMGQLADMVSEDVEQLNKDDSDAMSNMNISGITNITINVILSPE